MPSFSLDTKTSDSHIGTDVVLCAVLPCQLSCHVDVYRYSNINVSVCDHWEVNCNDLAHVCGLCHSASLSLVHHCANSMFVLCCSPACVFSFFFPIFTVVFTLQDFELINVGVKIIFPLCGAESQ